MALDNYPPGFDPKTLDDPFEALREYVGDHTEVRWNLTIEVDDEVVFESYYSTGDDMIMDGVRKGERSVEVALNQITEDRMQEMADREEEGEL